MKKTDPKAFIAEPTKRRSQDHHRGKQQSRIRRIIRATMKSKCPTCGGKGWLLTGEDDRTYREPCPDCQED